MAQAVQDGKTSAVAEATAAAAAQDPVAAAAVMAEAQSQAVARGAADQYAQSTAEAFKLAADKGTVEALSKSYAQVRADQTTHCTCGAQLMLLGDRKTEPLKGP